MKEYMTDIPTDGPQNYSRRVFGAMFEELSQEREATREAIADAKAKDPNKEPFDPEEFAKHYSPGDMGSTAQTVSPEVVEEYEAGYYLGSPETQTLAEYAAALRQQDAHEAN